MKLLRRRVCAGLAVGVCAGAAAALRPGTAQAAAASGFPRTLNDALGRRVRLAEAPQRIVAVFPSNVEIAFALGLEARIAAVGGRVFWPPEARDKPSVGGPLGYSAEAVAALAPDLIVVTPSHRSALGLIEPFARIGVPVLVLHHPDLPSILRNILLLGQAAACETRAQAVVDGMRGELAAVAAQVAGRPRPRVYLETAAAARGVYQTVGRGHYAHDALAWAGGENAFADLAGAAQVSGEAIFARDPDLIISLQKRPGDSIEIARRPGWDSLRAVRAGRVAVLPRAHKLIPGPRQIEAVRAYARAIHPEVFDV